MDRIIIANMNNNTKLALLPISNKKQQEVLDYLQKVDVKNKSILYWGVRLANYLDVPFSDILDLLDANIISDFPHNMHLKLSKIIIFPPTILDYLVFYKFFVPINIGNDLEHLLMLFFILSPFGYRISPALQALAIFHICHKELDYLYLLDEICQETLNNYREVLQLSLDYAHNLSELKDHFITALESLPKQHIFIGPKYLPDVKGLTINDISTFSKSEEIDKLLGKGSCGEIYTLKEDDKLAVKKFKHNLGLVELLQINNLSHKNIATLKALNSSSHTFLYYKRGYCSLNTYVFSISNRMDKLLIKSYMIQLTNAIYYCHMNLLTHNDIKPSNVILFDDGSIHLTDFGNATFINPYINLAYHNGTTPIYAGPETRIISNKPCDYAANDMWGLGMIMFFMLVKSNNPIFAIPYDEIEIAYKLLDNIRDWDEVIPDMDYDEASFLKKLLDYNPKTRITAYDAVKHPYISNLY